MGNDFLTKLLAQIFETFKMKNPKLAALVILLLLSLQYVATQGSVLGLFMLPEWLAGGIDLVSRILAALVGSSTFHFLSAAQQDKKQFG